MGVRGTEPVTNPCSVWIAWVVSATLLIRQSFDAEICPEGQMQSCLVGSRYDLKAEDRISTQLKEVVVYTYLETDYLSPDEG